MRFLQDNSYSTLGRMCFRQLIEILMGSGPTTYGKPVFYTIMKESRFFRQKKRDIRKALLFSKIFRFTDDPYAFDNDEFEINHKYIYLDVLELKKENEDPCKTSF